MVPFPGAGHVIIPNYKQHPLSMLVSHFFMFVMQLVHYVVAVCVVAFFPLSTVGVHT